VLINVCLPELSVPRKGWCGREDSNFHGLPHSDLNAARLPIPPRPHRGRCRTCPAAQHVAKGFWAHKGADEYFSQLCGRKSESGWIAGETCQIRIPGIKKPGVSRAGKPEWNECFTARSGISLRDRGQCRRAEQRRAHRCGDQRYKRECNQFLHNSRPGRYTLVHETPDAPRLFDHPTINRLSDPGLNLAFRKRSRR
jgi:hypothetical protein